MNTSLLLVYIGTTLLIFLPYFWFIVVGNKNSKKQEKYFSSIIKEKDLKLSIKEQWNTNLIGVDESKNILLFIKYNEENPIIINYNLFEIKECSLISKTKSFRINNKTEQKLQKVDLVLHLFENNLKIELNFFDTNDLIEEDLDIYRAEKWKSIIENILPKPKNFNKVA